MNKVKVLILALFSSFTYIQGHAQVEVTPTFKFEDGVYLSYESFQRNQPDIVWSDLYRRSITNPETLIAQVEYIRDRESGEDLSLEEIWGFSIAGLPFVHIPKDSIYKELSAFVGIRVAGKIAYYSYENRIEKEYEIAAYNPLNGEPFRKAVVKRPVTVFVEKIIDFESGEIYDFEKVILSKLMSDDPQLLTVLEELDTTSDSFKEQLFRLLMSYNRRHRVFFKP